MTVWGYRDVLVAAALAVGALWEAIFGPLAGPGYRGHPIVDTVACVLIVGAALVRRAHPLVFAAAVTAGTTLLWWGVRGLGELPFVGYSSYLLASYTLGAHLARRDAWLTGIGVIAAWGVPDVIDARAGLQSVHQDFGFFVLAGLALAAGVGVRHLRGQSAALRQALSDLAAERAAAEASAALAERHRIARDMHDVLTHTVSAVAVQAGALRLRLPGGEEADAVAALESCSRDALRELRQLLDVLREDDVALGPSPTLDDLERLTAPLVASGVDIEVRRVGLPAGVPAGPALAAYRLVQEGLTNIAKHAPTARSVTIVLDRREACLAVTVTNDGPVSSVGRPGHGIRGMSERLGAYGGSLDVGPCPDGAGWRVHGVLPL